MENWKDVVGYEGLYQVSDLGNVRSCERVLRTRWGGTRISPGKAVSQVPHHGGYLVVGLMRDGVFSQHLVHRLVARAFLGEPTEGQETRHGDNDRQNNRLSNLCWGTREQNAADKVLHGSAPIGANNPKARLNDDQVLSIVQMANDGAPQRDIATRFDVSEITVSHILCGRTWSHVTGIAFARKRVSVTPDLIERIAQMKREGKTLARIVDELGVSKATAFRYPARIEGALAA